MNSPREKTAVLSSSEQAALLRIPNPKAPTGLRNLCMMMLMLRAGLRAGEILDLKAEDINWNEGKIHVAESGAAKERTLWLDDELLALLENWHRIQPPGSSYFFSTLKGGRLKDRYLREMVKRTARKAGINKDVHPHLLRSTFAVNIIKEMNDIRLAQNALGHRDATTTQAYLKHLFEEHSMTYYDILGYRRSGIPAAAPAGAAKQDFGEENHDQNQGDRSAEISPRESGREEERREEAELSNYLGNENDRNNMEEERQNPVNKPEKAVNNGPGSSRSTGPDALKGREGTAGKGEGAGGRGPEKGDPDSGPFPELLHMPGRGAEDADRGKPIPALKCSRCTYILRHHEDCPQCGATFASILEHWRRNV